MYWNQFFNMEELSTDAEYAIMDDLIGDFDNFKTYKAWLGAQEEFTVTDKYKKKRKFTWGKPTIYITNNDPSLFNIDHAWIQENCTIVETRTPIITILPSNNESPGD